MTLPNDNMQPTIGTDMVVLVDPNDKEIGLMEKMENGKTASRAFSFSSSTAKASGYCGSARGANTAPACGPTPAAATPARRGPEAAAMRRLQKMGMYCQAPVFQFSTQRVFQCLDRARIGPRAVGYSDTAPNPIEEVASYHMSAWRIWSTN